MSLDLGREGLEYIAQEEGLEIVEALSCELTLDIDSDAEHDTSLDLWKVFMKNNLEADLRVGYLGILTTTSRNGGKHIYIRLQKELDVPTRIALQASLGSDRTRELLGILRELVGGERPCCMLETPEEYEKIMKWRESF